MKDEYVWSKDSLLRRLYSFGHYGSPKNLCQYVRGLCFSAGLLAVAVSVVSYLVAAMVTVLMYATDTLLGLFPASWYVTPDGVVQTFGQSLFMVGAIAWSLIIALFLAVLVIFIVFSLIERRKSRIANTLNWTPNPLIAYIAARKNRFCPNIRFE